MNFLLTNRLPRRLATRLVGRVSRIEQPLVRDASLKLWGFFADLDLSDAKQTRFRSLHDCFTRELKPGARPFDADPAVLASPCDAIVGACGTVEDGKVLQIKGLPYAVEDLLADADHAATFRDGSYVTLRLTSSMYHRFHAPSDLTVTSVTHIGGDTWNVNPIALKRVADLYCRNERAVIRTVLAAGCPVTLVPVAAILVASIRLHALAGPLHLRYRGPNELACGVDYTRGAELGYFENGSTIVAFVAGPYDFAAGLTEGATIRVGQPLLRQMAPRRINQ